MVVKNNKICRIKDCGALLVVGENWTESLCKKRDYICISCRKNYNKNYYLVAENREKILLRANEYASVPENKIKIQQYQKKYWSSDENKEKDKMRRSLPENRKKKRERDKIYNSKPENKKKQNKRQKDRRLKDPVFRFRQNITSSINKMLVKVGSSKNRISSKKWLDVLSSGQYYTRLINLLSILFALPSNLTSDGYVWMSFDNYGKYNFNTWKDDDPSTWTWNLDHVIPHSHFEYINIDCEEFKQCWALENLRPLSAKQNIIENNNRTQEQILQIKMEIKNFLLLKGYEWASG